MSHFLSRSEQIFTVTAQGHSRHHDGDPAYAGVRKTGLAPVNRETVLIHALLVDEDFECSV